MAITLEQQQLDRRKTVGGSDVPAIMSKSKFTTPWEKLLEKAGINGHKVDFKRNIYMTIGNVLEPLIQDDNFVINVDDEEYHYDLISGARLRCHIDGLTATGGAVEIKVTSYSLEDAFDQYLPQMMAYSLATGIDEWTLMVLNRDEDFNDMLKEFKSRKRLNNFGTYEWMDDVYAEHLEKELSEMTLEWYKTNKPVIQTKTINMKDYQKEIEIMKDTINTFWNYVERNRFAELSEEQLEQLKVQFETSLKAVRDINMESHEITVSANKVLDFEKQLVQFKEIEKSYKAEKTKLENLMRENGIPKWETPNGIKISLSKDTPDEETEEVNWEDVAYELLECYHGTEEVLRECVEMHTENKIKKGRKGSFRITIPKEKKCKK